jgi:hypothetical protein
MRIDAFNPFNTVTIAVVNNVPQVRMLTDPTPTNLSRDAGGTSISRAAGFSDPESVWDDFQDRGRPEGRPLQTSDRKSPTNFGS